MEALDLRVLRSIPTPVADSLVARGCRGAGDVFARPGALQEALCQLQAPGPERQARAILDACRREEAESDAWGSADSALQLLRRAQARPSVKLPCAGIGGLLGSALRPGGGILEVCGLPGTGKTQLCLQLCAAAQAPASTGAGGGDGFFEAVYVDAEGSFVPRRYAEVCEALLAERKATRGASNSGSGAGATGTAELEVMLRGLHVCRTYDAAELYATVKELGPFLQCHPRVRALVIDSLAFCFRHELVDNAPQRARVLADIAAMLRHYSAEHGLVVIVTNHMTTRFDRRQDDNGTGWLAPALGETWAHQPSTQLRLERTQQGGGTAPLGRPLGRATLTKSAERATGNSCLFQIVRDGVRDPEVGMVGQQIVAVS